VVVVAGTVVVDCTVRVVVVAGTVVVDCTVRVVVVAGTVVVDCTVRVVVVVGAVVVVVVVPLGGKGPTGKNGTGPVVAPLVTGGADMAEVVATVVVVRGDSGAGASRTKNFPLAVVPLPVATSSKA
jgi:hypothetical protein